jgi:hypothetical protein
MDPVNPLLPIELEDPLMLVDPLEADDPLLPMVLVDTSTPFFVFIPNSV